MKSNLCTMWTALFIISFLSGCITNHNDNNGNEPGTGNSISYTLSDTAIKDHSDTITICSFNIQFLGHFKDRDDAALADLIKDYDIVVVQEMVAPPVDGIYPDTSPFSTDVESAEFLSEMEILGFSYILSDEDTGPGEENHKNTSSTEWWIAFYKPDEVLPDSSLPHGFLADDRTDHPDYDRVPYAFAFRNPEETIDFVLISVHLHPNKSGEERRKHELAAIADWIIRADSIEKDFIILGDMNIQDQEELLAVTPQRYISLNDECSRTNTLINDNADQGARPYDHVMYNPDFTSEEIDKDFDIKVIDLVEEMRDNWDTTLGPYPGDPYDHNTFKRYYSDHHPVVFRMIAREDDD